MAADPVSRKLDWQHPWPGLAAYDEGSRDFFHGRDDETAELLRLVSLAPLTVLYGSSGLGKTSLLLAGLFPRLQAAHYLPVHLRLDFSEGAEIAPLEQAARRLEEEIGREGAEAPARDADEDLWRYLHRSDFELWSARNFPLIPVFVFDQFEEIFCRGGRREHVGAIFDSLADLIENRIPVELASDGTDREQQRRYDLRTQRYRVILSFREDFLPEFDAWKDKVPSLLNNRLRLLPMSREQAIRAVEVAGREVLADGVAPRIVDLVTRGDKVGGHGASADDRLEPTVEPVLLSLCCTRLNQRREPNPKIDAALVDSAGKDILEAFYAEAVGAMPTRVPQFIESQLIQGDKYRGSYPRDEAMAGGFLTRTELDTLTNQYRLLRIDQQADTARIELIHDRMVEVVRASRDERRAKEEAEQALRLQQQARQEAEHERQRREEAESAQARAEAERSRAERERGRAERQRTRANRMSMLFGACCVVFAVGAVAFWQLKDEADAARRSAVEATRKADTARLKALEARLVGEATAMLSGGRTEHPDRVLLQLMAAKHLDIDTQAVEGAMLKELLLRPQLLKLIPTEESVSGLAFIADGRKLVSTGEGDGTLQIYDALTGNAVGTTAAAHRGWVWAVAASPDGRRLVSAGEDGALQLWDVDADGAIRARGDPMTGHAARVKAVAFSPSGDYIVSGSDDKSLRLWDGRTGRNLGALLDEHNGSVNAVAFSPDGSRIVSGSDDSTLRLWDAASRWQIGEPFQGHERKVRSVAFSPDGRRIVSASDDRTLILWDAQTGEPVRGADRSQARVPLRGHSGGICCVAFSPAGPDGRVVFVSGAWDGELRLWEDGTGRPVGPPLSAYSRGLQSIAFAPDGRIASGSQGGGIAIWDPKASASSKIAEHGKLVTSVTFSGSGNRLASGAWDGIVRVWDADPLGEPRPLFEFDAGALVWSVALTADGNRVAAGGDDGVVRLWDIPGQRLVRAFDRLHQSMVWSVAFSPDGKRLASASQDGTVRLWDTDSGNALEPPLEGHQSGVNSVAFGPDGRIVSGGDDHTVRVWDADSHAQSARKPMLHQGPVLSVAFSHDGKRIVSGGADGKLRLWEAATGEAYKDSEDNDSVFTDRGGKVTSLAFSADDQRIVSGSVDGALRQWNASPDRSHSRAIDAWFRGHDGRVNSVAISPDGRSIVSGGSDRTVRRWPGPKAWPEQVCAKLTRNMSQREWRELISNHDPYRCQCPGLPIPADSPGRSAPEQICSDPAVRASGAGSALSSGGDRSIGRVDGRS